jgi:hypothetical protein
MFWRLECKNVGGVKKLFSSIPFEENAKDLAKWLYFGISKDFCMFFPKVL